MTTTTTNDPADDRAIHTSHLPWRLEFPGPRRATIREAGLGDSRAVSCRITALHGVRGAAEIGRTGGDVVALMMVRGGAEYLHQYARTSLVRPGQAVLWDGVCPMTCDTAEGVVKQTLFMPRERLRALFPRPEGLFARTVESSAALRLLGRWLAAAIDESAEDSSLTRFAEDLSAELVQCVLAGLDGGPGDSRAVLLAGIREFVDANLADPDLSLDVVAAANAVSLRYLHTLFADTGETPAGYLRRRRLERARELMRTRPSLAVHEVGERCGFASPSAFSRAFRARFGESPREARLASAPDRAWS